jgi:serine/threonine-protein kinase
MKLIQLGPYRVGKTIGKGGMGAVYEATDAQSGQQVAVKALNPQLAHVEGFRERFEAEIASLRTLCHEGIVRLYGFGEQDGILFYSMEMVHGTSLEEEIKAGRRFNWREVSNIAIQLCQALKHAHDHGVIHRDIKPANILIADDERVKLADFGIARLFGSYSGLTSAGGVLGTADYMSPEQADGRPVTHRCDQYSLGGVMYALLAGRPPFRAKSLPEMLQLQRFAQPEPVSRFARDTPNQLEGVITQLLSKDPADRFPNVQVLARHLQAMVRALSRPLPESNSSESPFGEQNLIGSSFDDSLPLDATQAEADSLPRTATNRVPVDAGRTAQRGDESETMLAGEPSELRVDRVASVVQPVATDAVESDPAPAGPATFTTVEEEAARLRREQSRTWPTVLAPLVGLAMLLVMLAGMYVYLSRPLTADQLYAKIATHVDDEDAGALRNVGSEIDEFLLRFPEEPRAAELRTYQVQLDLERAHRRLQFLVRHGGAADADLLPVEALYLEAMNAATTSPESAVDKLSSLVALYGADLPDQDPLPATSSERSSKPNDESDDFQRRAQCVHLAERQLAVIQEEIAKQTARHLASLRERMQIAAELSATEPAAAADVYRAIVELYGQAAWAADLVSEAREQLAASSQSASAQSASAQP